MTSFNNNALPLEMLGEIFQYLDDFDDLKAVTLTCKSWLAATQVTKVQKRIKLCFSFFRIAESHLRPLKLFRATDRKFFNLYFENTRISLVDEPFWTKFGESVSEVTLDYKNASPDLPGVSPMRLFRFFPCLRMLHLVCSLHLVNQGLEEMEPEERVQVLEILRNLTELQLYFSEDCLKRLQFDAWIKDFPKMKNIDFDVCSKKATIDEQTYEKLFGFMELHSKAIKGLHINDHERSLGKPKMERLASIQGLKLTALDLTIGKACAKLFESFLQTQDQLVFMTINGPFSIRSTIGHMPKLREMAISNADPLNGFRDLRFEKLESLGVAGLQFREDFTEENPSFELHPNPKMRELYFVDPTSIFEFELMKRICQSFQNLRLLNLDGAFIGDNSMLNIYANLRKLEELKLSKMEISDHGFFGQFTSPSYVNVDDSRSRNKRRKILTEVEASIEDLKELEVLNIDFCRRLTHRLLLKSLKFKKLKHFSAQGCNGFKDNPATSFGRFVKNNPQLEAINLSKCWFVTDRVVLELVKGLKNLETLELAECGPLTSVCLDHIAKHCKRIQTLDLKKCKFEIDPKEVFSRVESLRRIILHEKRLYRCDYEN